MRKVLLALSMILFMAAPALSGEGVEISGSVEIQYRNSHDLYAGKGDDEIKPEELYIQLSKEVAENIEALVKLDGADMNTGKATHKYVEEAQVIFKKVGGQPLTLVFGKDEMPFGQDYEKFLLNSMTHGFEIDKVWGVHGIYEIEGVGSVAAAFFKRDPDKDVGLTDSYTARTTADKLVKDISLEASYARGGKNEAVPAEKDENRYSIGATYKIADLTVHGEVTSFSGYKNTDGRDLSVIEYGADYRINKVLLKARHEIINDDLADQAKSQLGIGVSYYFSDKAYAALEYEAIGREGTGKDTEEFLAGFNLKF